MLKFFFTLIDGATKVSLTNCFKIKQLSTIDFHILTKSITSHNKKSLQKSLYPQQKKLSSLTGDCSLPIFTANETITNLTQYELSQEESDLLKAGLYFSIQPDKIRKSEIFTTFEKIYRFFINLKTEETKSQIKVYISCILPILISTTTNLLHLYYVNIMSYETLYPSGSTPTYIYGTPKMHKFSSSDSFPKLPLIVSSLGTFNYNLARFICDLLSPLDLSPFLIFFHFHSCKDTFSFVSQIKMQIFPENFLFSTM